MTDWKFTGERPPTTQVGMGCAKLQEGQPDLHCCMPAARLSCCPLLVAGACSTVCTWQGAPKVFRQAADWRPACRKSGMQSLPGTVPRQSTAK